MNTRIIFAAALLLASLAGGCGKSKDQNSAQISATSSTIPVEVAAVERQTLSVTKEFTGTLEGEEQANIVAKISERITAIAFQVGDPVKAGEVLVELDKSGATSQFYQAQAGYNNASKTYDRMKALYAEGAIALQVLDGAQTAFEVAKANFEAAKSAVELTTPIPGVVTAVNVSVGDLSTPGGVLATVAKIGKMKVDFDVNETDLSKISVGYPVEVYSEVRPGMKLAGRIVRVSRSADVRSHTFQIKAEFDNTADNWFRPGMFCRVDVSVSSGSNADVVPVSALQSDGITSRVYLVRNGRSFQQPVQVGVTDGKYFEILSGVGRGDTVITTGATNARDSGYVSISKR